MYIKASPLIANNQYPWCLTPVKELEAVFEDAPAQAKNIVRHLQDPHYFNDEGYQSAFFIGESGSDKTILAKAIALKARRDLHFFPAMALLGAQQHETATNLRDKVLLASTPSVIVLDDIDILFAPHQEVDLSAIMLRNILELRRGNHEFFLIGTTSRPDRLSQEAKDLMVSRCILIPTITDIAKKRSLLVKELTSSTCQLDPEIDESYLTERLSQAPTNSVRHIKDSALAVKHAYHAENTETEKMIIKKNHFDQAFEGLKQAITTLKYQ